MTRIRRTLLAAVVLGTLAARLGAQVSASADYSVTASSSDAGGGLAASADYANNGSVGGVYGSSTDGADYVANDGYAAQLFDVTLLTIGGTPTSLAGGDTVQLTATETLDDGSTLPVDPSTVTWSVLSGPIASVSPSGVATAGPGGSTDAAAVVQGSVDSVTGTIDLTVQASAPSPTPTPSPTPSPTATPVPSPTPSPTTPPTPPPTPPPPPPPPPPRPHPARPRPRPPLP